METNKISNFEDFSYTSKSLGIEINNNQLALFEKYYATLLDWNKKINLISRKEDKILEKHFLDSILFLPEIEGLINQVEVGLKPTSTNVLDIGSGGGFPGIPLAIMKPEWNFTLCESIKKKVGFFNHVTKELGLKNVKVINERVGAFHGTLLHPNNKYDLVTARAIAKLDVLIKYSLPLLKPGGSLIAYKAKDIDEEIKNAEKIIEKNKLKLKIFAKEINSIERKLVVITQP